MERSVYSFRGMANQQDSERTANDTMAIGRDFEADARDEMTGCAVIVTRMLQLQGTVARCFNVTRQR